MLVKALLWDRWKGHTINSLAASLLDHWYKSRRYLGSTKLPLENLKYLRQQAQSLLSWDRKIEDVLFEFILHA